MKRQLETGSLMISKKVIFFMIEQNVSLAVISERLGNLFSRERHFVVPI
jgi:hypothetical protein